MIDEKIMFSFCETDNRRESVCKPFKFGGNVFATNGHILCVVSEESYEGTDFSIFSGAKICSEQFFERYTESDMSPFDFGQLYEVCKKCGGKHIGVKPSECLECEGYGEVTLESDYNTYELECKSCKGKGEVNSCDRCSNVGKVYKKFEISETVDNKISGEYLEKIAGLINIRVGRTIVNYAISFAFDGGRGIIMTTR